MDTINTDLLPSDGEPKTAVEKHTGHRNDSSPTNLPAGIGSSISDGGLVAWLQVLGSFLLLFNSWGIINTFGAFQSYYESHIDASPSQISWIGSFQAFLLQIIGLIAGPAFDAGYFRQLILAGSFFTITGMITTSLCSKYWQVMLAQGICVGIGVGLTFVPSVAIVSTYFSTKRSLAIGIATTGSSVAGIIHPIIFQQLQPKIGFPWTIRIISFIMLATLAVAIVVMKQRVTPAYKRMLYDPQAFREPPFILFAIGAFLGFLGLYIPFFYAPSMAASIPGTSSSISFYSVTVICAASTFGRVIPNLLADKIGPLNMLALCAIISAIIAFSWIAVRSLGGLVTFCVFYGFFSGCFVSLPPSVIVALSPNVGIAGTRLGMAFAFVGLGLLIGNPIAGALLIDNDYLPLQVFCGATLVGSGILFSIVQYHTVRNC